MTSSTSHSESRVPVLALRLLGVAVVTWVACASYSLWLNPETQFYKELAVVQDAWSRKMEQEYGRKVAVFGGSSCMFSVIGEEALERYGLPIVNRGLAAGMSVKIPALNAMQDLKAGDTLIVALEPAQFTDSIEMTSMAVQFSYARKHPGWAMDRALNLPGSGKVSSLLALRPGSRHLLALFGKLLQGRALYRYKIAYASPSGWMRTDFNTAISGPPGHGLHLSDNAKQFLVALNEWCLEHDVRVAYSLPWGYSPADRSAGFRRDNAHLLIEIAKLIPVLRDPALGAHTDSGHFADTVWHLNEEGSRLRTDILCQAVKQWDVWPMEELQAIAAGNP